MPHKPVLTPVAPKGAALERSTLVARWREGRQAMASWRRAWNWTLYIFAATNLGFVALLALPSSTFRSPLAPVLGILAWRCLPVAICLSSMLAGRGPKWVPRLGLALSAITLVVQLTLVLTPLTLGSLIGRAESLLAAGAMTLALVSLLLSTQLPRSLTWIKVLTGLMILSSAIGLALLDSPDPWSKDSILLRLLWFMAVGSTFLLAVLFNQLLFLALCSWRRLTQGVFAAPRLGTSSSLALFATTTAAVVVFLNATLGGLPDPFGSAQITFLWSGLILGTALASMALFSVTAPTSNTPRRERT